MMRKGVLFLAASILLCGILPACARAVDAPRESAGAAALLDTRSGTLLYASNADAQLGIASTTKVMTALVALERTALTDLVEIPAACTRIEGSSIYLRPGEQLSVETLLYGLLLESGNDAAEALAWYVSGSSEAFAEEMNRKASELGLANTHFTNPSGLDDAEHYSTATDLARLFAAAMENPDFARITAARSFTSGERTFYNHNRLLRECAGVIGGKTGYTRHTGRTLVTCAEREGLRLVCVTLNDRDDWNDHAALYDWGYSRFRQETPVSADRELTRLPVISGTAEYVGVRPADSITLLVRDDQDLTVRYMLPRFVYAQVQIGGTAGWAAVYSDGQELARVRLIFTAGVPQDEGNRLTLWEQIRRGLRMSLKYGGTSPYAWGVAARTETEGNRI